VNVWPWEHLAFGYVLFSASTRLLDRRSPTDPEALAVAVATQFPDLIDKPLAWTFDVLPSGLSLAHSLSVATLLTAGTAALARRRGVPGQGLAVAIGYGSHLLGDAVYPVAFGDPVRTSFLLWPFLGGPQPASTLDGTDHVVAAIDRVELLISTPIGPWALLLEGLLLGGAVGVWLADGTPGTDVLRSGHIRKPTE